MNPHQQNKVDISSLSPDEQRLFRLYGKMPTKKDLLQNKLKVYSSLNPVAIQERKYFDSGDYALSKAGKASDVGVTSIGSRHPLPENIPHLTATSPPQSSTIPSPFNGHPPGLPHQGSSNAFQPGTGRSPIKEGSFLHRETNVDDQPEQPQQKSGEGEAEQDTKKDSEEGLGVSPPHPREGLPIRR
ncbi:hypothetical protein FQN50_005979 [Emmonsiellopsis sp. PD_5]|nr:hypothetical protein FQN50_005979 [Emmonsiellopsis sp. PD_5]